MKKVLPIAIAVAALMFNSQPSAAHKKGKNPSKKPNTQVQDATDTSSEELAQMVAFNDEGSHSWLIPSLVNAPDENASLNIDSLLNRWYVDKAVKKSFIVPYYLATDVFPSDSVLEERIKNIPSMMQFVFNDDVKTELKRYLNTSPNAKSYIESMIGKAEYYFPLFEETLMNNGLPLELKCLPIIESAINPVAVSRAGATGMWQFMNGTGKFMSLNINKLIDERRDPAKATLAAAKYLKTLFNQYNDWALALAAYNCGPGNINKAIARSGKKSYWEIQPYLPRETQKYVPRFIAAVYLMSYYKEHQLVPRYFDMPTVTDTVVVTKKLNMPQMASALNIPIDVLRNLNPQYKKDITIGEKLTLNLPLQHSLKFMELKDSIYNMGVANLAGDNGQNPNGKVKIMYEVKKGESINTIAKRFGVKTTNIRSWNELSNNKVSKGDQLELLVSSDKAKKYQAPMQLSAPIKADAYASADNFVPTKTTTKVAVAKKRSSLKHRKRH